jgi:hypothetical protein
MKKYDFIGIEEANVYGIKNPCLIVSGTVSHTSNILLSNINFVASTISFFGTFRSQKALPLWILSHPHHLYHL